MLFFKKPSSILSLFLFVVVVMLQGCTTYPALATFEQSNEVLDGAVHANLLAGGNDFQLTGNVTGLVCKGHSNVTHIPPFGQCRDQRGDIFMTCDDVRTATGEWSATTCTSGYGAGKDNLGNKFVFTFGMDHPEATKFIA